MLLTKLCNLYNSNTIIKLHQTWIKTIFPLEKWAKKKKTGMNVWFLKQQTNWKKDQFVSFSITKLRMIIWKISVENTWSTFCLSSYMKISHFTWKVKILCKATETFNGSWESSQTKNIAYNTNKTFTDKELFMQLWDMRTQSWKPAFQKIKSCQKSSYIHSVFPWTLVKIWLYVGKIPGQTHTVISMH